MGRSQAVRQRILIPPRGGSNPPAPATQSPNNRNVPVPGRNPAFAGEECVCLWGGDGETRARPLKVSKLLRVSRHQKSKAAISSAILIRDVRRDAVCCRGADHPIKWDQTPWRVIMARAIPCACHAIQNENAAFDSTKRVEWPCTHRPSVQISAARGRSSRPAQSRPQSCLKFRCNVSCVSLLMI